MHSLTTGFRKIVKIYRVHPKLSPDVYTGVSRGFGWVLTCFPTFVAEFKNDKTPNSFGQLGRGVGVVLAASRMLTYFLTFVAEFKITKFIPFVWGWKGGGVMTDDLLSNLVAEFKNGKIPNSFCWGLTYFPTFVAEFKSDKITNLLFFWG